MASETQIPRGQFFAALMAYDAETYKDGIFNSEDNYAEFAAGWIGPALPSESQLLIAYNAYLDQVSIEDPAKQRITTRIEGMYEDLSQYSIGYFDYFMSMARALISRRFYYKEIRTGAGLTSTDIDNLYTQLKSYIDSNAELKADFEARYFMRVGILPPEPPSTAQKMTWISIVVDMVAEVLPALTISGYINKITK
ncbi:hypothetical protein G4Y79_05260 [Phototrophicus methaneseepsis]|uniref:Uncharacterized protein n=1 Tax=Phototrophicus methaneseepsis TaxID=2710758 RepID=A0A7S8IFS3_9CHLR|nr:hypothetical protein [Phototrophicus methaneseepsis]QPC83789.1 hypothetical protein G4Y79_05260 [Phototrophicus methaneseepsis]